MPKQKTISELKAEIAASERQLAQLRHKQQQLENRAAYYEKGDRRKRAHRLITRGAAIESVAPLAKVLSETEFYAFAEKAFAFDQLDGQKVPSRQALHEEFNRLLVEKKQAYAEYRQVKKEMQEYLIAKQTVEHILGIDRHKRVEEKKQQKEEQR